MSNNTLSVDDLNTDFLPLIYDIIRSYERDAHDVSSLGQKTLAIANREPQQSSTGSAANDANQKLQQLKDRFSQFRQQVTQINGIGVTQEEQLNSLDALRQQLSMKRDLLIKYKNSCPFDSNHKI
ncbi:mediator of RNA polymerase II transcription subunit 9-like [Oppia nitens]|uniref:mediator of RNA polymerase II transcription subunit 9-like n=1 Tax=Oppia nitens TaxID=1686743 RepID=UPI0023DA63BA|nr:mediator of RNA polymerase II transcription subunit 9-like [Oppia nitens]